MHKPKIHVRFLTRHKNWYLLYFSSLQFLAETINELTTLNPLNTGLLEVNMSHKFILSMLILIRRKTVLLPVLLTMMMIISSPIYLNSHTVSWLIALLFYLFLRVVHLFCLWINKRMLHCRSSNSWSLIESWGFNWSNCWSTWYYE